MRFFSILLVGLSLCFIGCSTMNTAHICLDCDAKLALSENDQPDFVGKTKACWFEKYDSGKDREGKYCIYWDANYKIQQYGFESYEDDSAVLLMMYK
ncbi:hypothetical protein [Fibrobacter sp.]|uniref:hypothetical protein n=1 Tax=Fibrobacter sp. TaxID=35828 RepID=UPI00388D1146